VDSQETKLVNIDGDVQVLGRNKAVKLMLEKSAVEQMKGLCDPQGRKRLAEVVVWEPRRAA
jgi:hypothetical protein